MCERKSLAGQQVEEQTPFFVSNFDLIRLKPSGGAYTSLADINLDTVHPIIPNEDTLVQHFKSLVSGWKSVFSAAKVLSAFEQDDTLYLKRLRRIGMPLKMFYKVCDIKHKEPQALENIIYNLGQLFDARALGIPDDAIVAQYKAPISDLNNLMQIENFDYPFSPVSLHDFKKEAHTRIIKVQSYFQTDTSTAPQFHSARKALRMILNIYQIPASMNLNSADHWIFHHIYELSHLLGQNHDLILKQSDFYGDKYNGFIVNSDPKYLERFEEVLPYIVSGLDLSNLD